MKVNLSLIYFQPAGFCTDSFINWRIFIILQGQLSHQGQAGPFGTLPLLHLHILSNVHTHWLYVCTYPSNLKRKGEINLYMHLTYKLTAESLEGLRKDQVCFC